MRRVDGLTCEFVRDGDAYGFPSYRRVELDLWCRRLPNFGWAVCTSLGEVQEPLVPFCPLLGCLQKKFLPQSKHSHRCLSVTLAPRSGYVPVLPHLGHIGAIIEFYGRG